MTNYTEIPLTGYRRDNGRVNGHNQHLSQQDPDGIRFVKVEDVSKPNFVVVFDHHLDKCKTMILNGTSIEL